MTEIIDMDERSIYNMSAEPKDFHVHNDARATDCIEQVFKGHAYCDKLKIKKHDKGRRLKLIERMVLIPKKTANVARH